jgi:hypothetical protein
MPYTKSDVGNIKQGLIQWLLELDVPKDKLPLRDSLVAQLKKKDYVIAGDDAEKDAAIYIEKVLKSMFEPQPEAKPRFKSK